MNQNPHYILFVSISYFEQAPLVGLAPFLLLKFQLQPDHQLLGSKTNSKAVRGQTRFLAHEIVISITDKPKSQTKTQALGKVNAGTRTKSDLKTLDITTMEIVQVRSIGPIHTKSCIQKQVEGLLVIIVIAQKRRYFERMALYRNTTIALRLIFISQQKTNTEVIVNKESRFRTKIECKLLFLGVIPKCQCSTCEEKTVMFMIFIVFGTKVKR